MIVGRRFDWIADELHVVARQQIPIPWLYACASGQQNASECNARKGLLNTHDKLTPDVSIGT
jgi:hypothetical protein